MRNKILSIVSAIILMVVSTDTNAQDKEVMRHNVTFKNGQWKMAGHLYLPENFDESKAYPAIVITHPGGGVKEQTAGLYAKHLVEKGFITLAYDASHQGESEGEPRLLDDPYNRIEDVKSAVDYLTSLPYIDNNRIGGLGVCAGGGYTVNASITDKRIRAIAGVSPVDAGLSTRHGWDGTRPLSAQFQLLKDIDEARTAEANGAEPKLTNYVPATVNENTHPDMVEAHEYYLTARGQHPNSVNYCLLKGFAGRLSVNLLPLITDYLTQPLLIIVGSNAGSRWQGEKMVELKKDSKELFVIDGATHIDLYDIPKYVDQAVTKLDSFFRENL